MKKSQKEQFQTPVFFSRQEIEDAIKNRFGSYLDFCKKTNFPYNSLMSYVNGESKLNSSMMLLFALTIWVWDRNGELDLEKIGKDVIEK